MIWAVEWFVIMLAEPALPFLVPVFGITFPSLNRVGTKVIPHLGALTRMFFTSIISIIFFFFVFVVGEGFGYLTIIYPGSSYLSLAKSGAYPLSL